MASLSLWTWVWVNSGCWRWTGRPDMLQFMGSQRVGHNWMTELNWEFLCEAFWSRTFVGNLKIIDTSSVLAKSLNFFAFVPYLVLEVCVLLMVYPFLLSGPVCWHITACKILLWLYFWNIGCNFYSMVSIIWAFLSFCLSFFFFFFWSHLFLLWSL